MSHLYPLKFKPIPREMIWGGNKLAGRYNKDFPADAKIGESWEISSYPGYVSIAVDGPLAGNTIEELTEVYMGDLVGENIFNRFGLEFPLLIKLIDASDVLSVQVHPDDELAAIRHNGNGKTEMWYVLDAEDGAELICGFNSPVSPGLYTEKLNSGRLTDILNVEKVSPGDVFFIPAGRVHAIGKGIVLAEIQQSSDTTYRIYDWDRKDDLGNLRQLHTDLAMEAIDFEYHEEYRTQVERKMNVPVIIGDCPYFTTSLLEFDREAVRDYGLMDSFIIYICTEGKFTLEWESGQTKVAKGETLLIPAVINGVNLRPHTGSALLEVYIK